MLLKMSCNSKFIQNLHLVWQVNLTIGSCGNCIPLPLREPNLWRCNDCRKDHLTELEESESDCEWDFPLDSCCECFMCCEFKSETHHMCLPTTTDIPKILWNRPVRVCEECLFDCDNCNSRVIHTKITRTTGHGLCEKCSASCIPII